MTPEQKAKWTSALRSGSYTQVSGALSKGGCHCALGVACDIFAEEAGVGRQTFELSDGTKMENFDNMSGYLPSKLQKFLSLSGKGGLPTVVKMQGTKPGTVQHFHDIVTLNDNAKMTFPQIADIIDEQF